MYTGSYHIVIVYEIITTSFQDINFFISRFYFKGDFSEFSFPQTYINHVVGTLPLTFKT